MYSNGSYVLAPGTAERRWMGATFTDFLASGELTGGKFAMVDETAPRGTSVPLHTHAGDDESFYVVEGKVAFFVGEGTPRTGGPGTFVHIPGGVVHGFRVESDSARYLILTTVRHGDFYKAITLPSRAGGLAPAEQVDGEMIGRACGEFGITFVGPLPAKAETS